MITEIASPMDFLIKTKVYRSEYPYETQQISSDLIYLCEKGFEVWRFLAIEKADQVVAMIMLSPNDTLFISPMNSEISSEVSEYLLTLDIRVQNIIGEMNGAKNLASAIKTISSFNIDVVEELKTMAYVLSSLNLFTSQSGVWRSVSISDRELLIQWNTNFVREVSGREPENVVKFVDRTITDNKTFFWVEDGTPVSMLSYTEPTLTPIGNIVRIFRVYTSENFRGRGFAKILVSQICSKLNNENMGVMLFADTKNLQANEIYKRVGFTEIGIFGKLLLKVS
jgi:predicted GNAT family acetyltransferase